MQFCVLFLLLNLTCLYITLAQGSYEDCCLKYVKGVVGRGIQKKVVEYRRQVVDGECNIPATVFTMKNRRMFCADPRAKWVSDLMKKIDEKKSRKHRPKRRRPKRS